MSPDPRAQPEAGFTVLEAILAFAVVLGVALGAAELLRASFGAQQSAAERSAASAAARSALARIGADIPARPGVYERRERGVAIRVEIAPFAGRERVLEQEASAPDPGRIDGAADPALNLIERPNKRPRSLRGAPLTATATARTASGRIARIAEIVIGPAERSE